jgi:hypothetical protein
MLNTSLVDSGQHHSCVPQLWWKEYASTFPSVHPCAGCNPTPTCPHIPKRPGTHSLARDGAKLVVVTSVLSNFATADYTDPVAPAVAVAAAAALNVSQLRQETVAWWAAFWAKSNVSLPSSPAFETQWYGSLYVLASSHATDGSPFAVAPGIVWPKTSDSPAFRGAFTMNYNQEALYYGVYSANHPELAGPYYNAMLQYIPRGRKDATSYFQCPGINMDCEIFHWGQSTSGVGDQGQRSNAALAAVPFANHWLWTRDKAWLQSTGWPFLDEVALFWECYLQEGHPGTPAGSYSSVNDCFDELCSSDPDIVNVNPHITMSLLRFLLPVFVDAAAALGIEEQRQATWRHLYANLAPLPTVGENATRMFTSVLGSTKGAPQRGENPLWVYLGWPGWDDSLENDTEVAATLKNTVDFMQSWSCGNCWPQYPQVRLRTQDYATQVCAHASPSSARSPIAFVCSFAHLPFSYCKIERERERD